jgi:hypothetical protein
LNWGSSYLIHDFYRRFVNKTADEKHYVNAGRLCTFGLYVIAALLSLKLDSAQEAFQVLLSIGAGTGLLYLLRWFWWRINAWCEVVAMASSLLVTLLFFVLGKMGHHYPFAPTLLIEVAFTTICWLVTAFVSPGTTDEQLIAFYKKVHPAGPGWTKVRLMAGVSEANAALHGDHMGMATVGWISGCVTIWSSLFAIGNFLYGRMTSAFELTAIFIVSGLTLLWVINHLWDKTPVTENVAEPLAV